jgi:hypothetical protein
MNQCYSLWRSPKIKSRVLFVPKGTSHCYEQSKNSLSLNGVGSKRDCELCATLGLPLTYVRTQIQMLGKRWLNANITEERLIKGDQMYSDQT